MALEDIVFPDGDPQNFIQTMNRGNAGTVSDYLTESDSNSGMLLNELPSNTSATSAFTWVA
ncbi:hypothetical protein E6Q11_03390 [Candidatus Dojkabacteria bacterium]|uniref:Uncharacterized protein n=1 Tax=Candidatus Dojkabacteria bacterium TaxID=2099670 RepID=A0A5C7J6G3_9BACT|nr:MAG: hypothetical protein E6Q11_03390 [Candidatus Dojkabacteria bacterium]